ncbi:MAG TPA: hypothetical protein VI589_02255 [Vicinamibacteria bacterium]
MASSEPIPLVRCRLSGAESDSTNALRYVPLGEFGLWKHLMETRHGRQVSVESISVWIAEESARWNSGFAAEDLEPVLRVRLEVLDESGVCVPVERYFPAETYPMAQEALLKHFEGTQMPERVVAVPGYFVPRTDRAPEAPEVLLLGV